MLTRTCTLTLILTLILNSGLPLPLPAPHPINNCVTNLGFETPKFISPARGGTKMTESEEDFFEMLGLYGKLTSKVAKHLRRFNSISL